jgi:hypothetical protein
MFEPVESRATAWTRASWAYGGLVVFALGYLLFDIPVQVTDSYGNLVQAADGTLGSLVYRQFFARGFLRPFLWGHLRVVYDLSGGHYYEWFRGWHVGQLAVLVALFLRLLRPRTPADAAVVPLGLAVLIGVHTFAGTVDEAFPVNTFMTILLCVFAATDLALGPPRWWRDVAAVVLFVFAALTVESGLLVAVALVAARLAGAKGVSPAGAGTVVLLVFGYLALRFVVLQVGAPGLDERSSGFGFSSRSPSELAALFGGSPLPFYAYNAGTAFLSLLFSEPRAGVWLATRNLIEGELAPSQVVNVVASTLGTAVVAAHVWRRRQAWWARTFDRGDQLVIVFLAVAGANAAISYAYTKDVILSPAGACYALAVAVAARDLLQRTWDAPPMKAALAGVLLLALSGTWAFRAVGLHVGLREGAAVVRNEWAYVDTWLDEQKLVPATPTAQHIKDQLQGDAIWRHPVRPAVTGDWVEWFAEE